MLDFSKCQIAGDIRGREGNHDTFFVDDLSSEEVGEMWQAASTSLLDLKTRKSEDNEGSTGVYLIAFDKANVYSANQPQGAQLPLWFIVRMSPKANILSHFVIVVNN